MSETAEEAGVARALRALAITGRRLFRLSDGRWGVLRSGDRRRRPLAILTAETAERLVGEGKLCPADEETFVLTGAGAAPAWPPPPPRAVFLAACARRPGRTNGGVGFAGLAKQAREGRGPLLLRHVQAGLRLVADAEQASADPRVTMNWDAGPVTRQRRAGIAGGQAGRAQAATRRLKHLRAKMGDEAWRLAWALCVDADTLRKIRARFAIAQRDLHARVGEALEKLAAAYEG